MLCQGVKGKSCSVDAMFTFHHLAMDTLLCPPGTSHPYLWPHIEVPNQGLGAADTRVCQNMQIVKGSMSEDHR